MSAIASQITSLTIVYSTVYSGADQRKHQSSLSLAFVRGIHQWPVNSPHKEPVTRNFFPLDDVIMKHVANEEGRQCATELELIWANNDDKEDIHVSPSYEDRNDDQCRDY